MVYSKQTMVKQFVIFFTFSVLSQFYSYVLTFLYLHKFIGFNMYTYSCQKTKITTEQTDNVRVNINGICLELISMFRINFYLDRVHRCYSVQEIKIKIYYLKLLCIGKHFI